MITDRDINKMKIVFATVFATKEDLNNSQQSIIDGIRTIIEMLGKEKTRNDEQDDILDHHEHRLDKIEDKVYSSN